MIGYMTDAWSWCFIVFSILSVLPPFGIFMWLQTPFGVGRGGGGVNSLWIFITQVHGICLEEVFFCSLSKWYLFSWFKLVYLLWTLSLKETIESNAHTSSLPGTDMREVEGAQEVLLFLQLGGAIHLFGGVRRRQRGGRQSGRLPLHPHGGRWRGAALPHHPPPLPPLALQKLVAMSQGNQATRAQEVHFLQWGSNNNRRVSVTQNSPLNAVIPWLDQTSYSDYFQIRHTCTS